MSDYSEILYVIILLNMNRITKSVQVVSRSEEYRQKGEVCLLFQLSSLYLHGKYLHNLISSTDLYRKVFANLIFSFITLSH